MIPTLVLIALHQSLRIIIEERPSQDSLLTVTGCSGSPSATEAAFQSPSIRDSDPGLLKKNYKTTQTLFEIFQTDGHLTVDPEPSSSPSITLALVFLRDLSLARFCPSCTAMTAEDATVVDLDHCLVF